MAFYVPGIPTSDHVSFALPDTRDLRGRDENDLDHGTTIARNSDDWNTHKDSTPHSIYSIHQSQPLQVQHADQDWQETHTATPPAHASGYRGPSRYQRRGRYDGSEVNLQEPYQTDSVELQHAERPYFPAIDPVSPMHGSAETPAKVNIPTKGYGISSGHASHNEYERKYPYDIPGETLGPNARVWEVYSDEAGIYDNDMIKRWNSTIDGLVVFAGIFSAVVTTLVVQSSQALQPTSQSSIMIEQLVTLQLHAMAGNNVSMLALVAPATHLATSDLWINGLWFASLTLSLAIAMISGVIKQWLLHFDAPILGTTREKVCVRHFRYTGLQQWHVPIMIAVLPGFMHIALILFFVGLFIFANQLSQAIAFIILIIMGITLLSYAAFNAAGVIYVDCPYKTPFSTILNYQWQILYILYSESEFSLIKHLFKTINQIYVSFIKPIIAKIKHKLNDFEGLSSIGFIEKKYVNNHLVEIQQNALLWLYDTSSSPAVSKIVLQSLADWDSNFYDPSLLIKTFLNSQKDWNWIEEMLIDGQTNITDRVSSFWTLVSLSNLWLYNKGLSQNISQYDYKPIYKIARFINNLDLPEMYQVFCNFPSHVNSIDWSRILTLINKAAGSNMMLYDRLLTFMSYQLYVSNAHFFQGTQGKGQWIWLSSWFLHLLNKIKSQSEKSYLLHPKNKSMIKSLYWSYTSYDIFKELPRNDQDYYKCFEKLLIYMFDYLSTTMIKDQLQLFFELHYIFMTNDSVHALPLTCHILNSTQIDHQDWHHIDRILDTMSKNLTNIDEIPPIYNFMKIIERGRKKHLKGSNFICSCLTTFRKCPNFCDQTNVDHILTLLQNLYMNSTTKEEDLLLWNHISTFINYDIIDLDHVKDVKLYWYLNIYLDTHHIKKVSSSAFLTLIRQHYDAAFWSIWISVIEAAEERNADNFITKEEEESYIDEMKKVVENNGIRILSAEPHHLSESTNIGNAGVLSIVHQLKSYFLHLFFKKEALDQEFSV